MAFPKKERCKYCRFSKITEKADGGFPAEFECRHDGPKIIMKGSPTRTESHWPPVEADDWCGKFEFKYSNETRKNGPQWSEGPDIVEEGVIL
jgi:hypothetical protein